MNSITLILISFIGYVIAYHTYGKFMANKLFTLSSKYVMPSKELEDGVDFVPTKKSIVFGHHFTTIAGLGPIVGPAIGIIWGWLPAVLWIFFGSIFMGAVHDFSTLVISGRNKGKTIGDLTGNVIGKGPRNAFQIIIQFLLFIVLAVFALIVSTLFVMYPEAVLPVWLQIPIAVWLGNQIRKGKSELWFSIIALLLMYASIVLGVYFPVDLLNTSFFQGLTEWGMKPANMVTVTWCIVLYIYVYIASTLPVHRLLQPRDYINSHQLLVAIVLILLGIFIAHPVISAPGINTNAFKPGNDVPDMLPVLFIIIACGAISGFHSIASSGTTVKQLKNEKDSLLVGYGSMLLEGFLAIIVIVSIAAGLGIGFTSNNITYKGSEAFYHYYSSWAAANAGIGAKIESFITGAANLLNSLGIPLRFGRAMIAVFIVSFANTTLDSATRMQRLSLQEIFKPVKNKKVSMAMANRYVATLVVVLFAAIMTFLKPGGTGALLLWPLFGALNQLLAALGLTVVSVYLYKKGKKYLISFIPMVFVLLMTIWSMINNLQDFIHKQDVLLSILSIIILGLTLWLLIGSVRSVIGETKKK